MTAGTPAPTASGASATAGPATVPVKTGSQDGASQSVSAFSLAVVAIYVLSLVGVHLLAKSGPKLPAVDLSQYQQEDSIVQLRVEELKTVANRLSVNVLVYP